MPANAQAQDRQAGVATFLGAGLGEGPWRVDDAMRWAVRVGAGGLAVLVSWAVAANTGSFATQMACMAVAVGGVLVSAIASLGWLISGFGPVSRERRWIKNELSALYGPDFIHPSPDPIPGTDLVTGLGMRRYHRKDCDVVVGKGVSSVSPAAIEEAGLVPCGMCRS